MNGLVVRGVGGRRDEYRPLVSTLVDSARPLDVARCLRDHFGLDHYYLADLDGILGEIPHWEAIGWLVADGFRLDVDMGVRELNQAERLLRRGTHRVIVALESLADPEQLENWVRKLGTDRMIFSLDLQGGAPLVSEGSWPQEPLEIVDLAASAGVTQLIVLDLAHVGSDTGVGTVELCRRIAEKYPLLSITTGGGVRNADDLRQLSGEPIDGVLIASALHDGKLSPQDLRPFVNLED